ncbi:hypothetical protein CM49_05339 [Paenibacillus sp. P1XP2]|nr:hypothetical protein CM49_05339 [Paenibacillus sp. P1XP2]
MTTRGSAETSASTVPCRRKKSSFRHPPLQWPAGLRQTGTRGCLSPALVHLLADIAVPGFGVRFVVQPLPDGDHHDDGDQSGNAFDQLTGAAGSGFGYRIGQHAGEQQRQRQTGSRARPDEFPPFGVTASFQVGKQRGNDENGFQPFAEQDERGVPGGIAVAAGNFRQGGLHVFDNLERFLTARRRRKKVTGRSDI